MSQSQRIRILYVDDYPLDRELVRDALTKENAEFELIEAASREEFETALAKGGFDLVLSDFNILGFEGLQVLSTVHTKDASIPVIIVTGTGSEEVAVEAMKQGAADYVIKKLHHIHRLPLTILAVMEKKRMEQEKRESEERFRLLFENSGDAILLTDLDGYVYSANAEACRIFQMCEEEITRLGWQQLFDPMDPRLPFAIEERMRTGKFRGEMNLVRKDGTIFPTEISATVFKDQFGNERIGLIVRDITERKRIEDQLRESEERFSNAFYYSPIGIALTDLQTSTVRDVNNALLEMIGLPREQMVGRNVLELSMQIDPAVQKVIGQDLLAYGNFFNKEVQIRPVNGELRAVLLSAAFVKIGGQPHNLALFHDITDRKRAEDRILRQLDYLNALRVIDQAITSTFDLHLSLNTLLDKTISLLSVDAASVLFFNPTLSMLEFAAGQGFQTGSMGGAIIKLSEGLAGRAVTERQLVQVSNLAAELDYPLLDRRLQGENFVSYCGVPLIAKGKVIGVLELFNRSVVERDQEWLDFLHTLAEQAAIAIDNAQLFDSLQKSNLDLSMAYDATIEGWSHALDLRDKETEGHTLRVVESTMELTHRMGLRGDQLIQVHRGALLHDIGKLGVPDGILLKPGPLTEEEWSLMKKHPTFAYEMLSPIEYLAKAVDIPYCHHEKWDGTGYPRGLKKELIPLTARIFSVVDVYDALTSDRPYRQAWGRDDSINYIHSLSGKQFDPQVVEVFLKMI